MVNQRVVVKVGIWACRVIILAPFKSISPCFSSLNLPNKEVEMFFIQANTNKKSKYLLSYFNKSNQIYLMGY